MNEELNKKLSSKYELYIDLKIKVSKLLELIERNTTTLWVDNLEYTVDNYNIYNCQAWDLPVETGQIVLFPGHVFHMPRPNLSKTPKILIGANFFIKGALGSHDKVTFLKSFHQQSYLC